MTVAGSWLRPLRGRDFGAERQCRGQALRRGLVVALAVVPILAGCGSDGPTGVPFAARARDLAGIYRPTQPSGDLDFRLVLGTRFNVTGRYQLPDEVSGELGPVVRYEGSWRRSGNTLVVEVLPTQGLPAAMEFDVSEETIRTPVSIPFQPEGSFVLETDILRLRGVVVIEGAARELDLSRIVSNVVPTGGGGIGRS